MPRKRIRHTVEVNHTTLGPQLPAIGGPKQMVQAMKFSKTTHELFRGKNVDPFIIQHVLDI